MTKHCYLIKSFAANILRFSCSLLWPTFLFVLLELTSEANKTVKMISATTRALVTPSRVLARSFHHQTWVSGPPRTRISLPEKIAHGVLITFCILFTPMYIMSNIKNYRAKSD
jgi:Cytochrome oxidase c subunit VIII